MNQRILMILLILMIPMFIMVYIWVIYGPKKGKIWLRYWQDMYIIFEYLLSDVSVMSPKVLPGNTPQYLSKIKSDCHKIFSKYKYWSPGLIDNVRGHIPSSPSLQWWQGIYTLHTLIKSRNFAPQFIMTCLDDIWSQDSCPSRLLSRAINILKLFYYNNYHSLSWNLISSPWLNIYALQNWNIMSLYFVNFIN